MRRNSETNTWTDEIQASMQRTNRQKQKKMMYKKPTYRQTDENATNTDKTTNRQ